MSLSGTQLILVEQRLANNGPSTVVAWLLYFFTGYFGIHRFYLGRRVSGVIMFLTFGGFLVWYILDIFFISGMIQKRREEIRRQITVDMLASGEGAS
jgi:TM2 domain-containing membrane protein YozV